MENRFSSKEKKVGLFMIVMALVLLGTIFALGRGKDWFRSYVRYYTVLNETYNLNENASVRMSKAEIGKVKRISLTGDKVKVEIAVLKDYAARVRQDSIATVESPTFIGSEYISIKPGSSRTEPVQEGGEIRAEAKKSLDDLMAEFQVTETAKKVVQAVQDLSDVAGKLRDPKGPLFAALDNTNRILAHIENVTREVREGRGPVGEILKSEAMVKGLRQDMERINRILVHVEKTASNIEKGSEDVPEVTRATRRGVGEVREGVKNIDNVVQAIQKNPFIRPNLPPEPKSENVDAGLRK